MRTYIKFLFISLLVFSCKQSPLKEKQPFAKVQADSIRGPAIADTIIYDVIIHNTNPEDQWAEQCLQYMNEGMLVDSLFNLVYEGKVVAYDFFENRPLSIKEVKKLEAQTGFKRENIGKIQFTERWSFDASRVRFQKDVLAIVLGYDLFDEEGKIRGHKPVFKLTLNP
jgi:hypothetical protein